MTFSSLYHALPGVLNLVYTLDSSGELKKKKNTLEPGPIAVDNLIYENKYQPQTRIGIFAQNLTIRTCLAAKEAGRGSLAAAKGAVKAWLVLFLKRGYIVGDNQLN